MRRVIATVLGLGISAGVAAMIMLQRWVAEIDDGERRDHIAKSERS